MREQSAIDKIMLDMDGTENKCKDLHSYLSEKTVRERVIENSHLISPIVDLQLYQPRVSVTKIIKQRND